MLFFLSTITIIAALLVAKLLTTTVLTHMETAPFVMELPHYHPPTIRGVAQRAIDRTWTYIKKVGTVVVAISVVVFVLLHFPGLSHEQETHYRQQAEAAIAKFYKKMEGNPYLEHADTQEELVALVNVYTAYKAKKLNAQGKEASCTAPGFLDTSLSCGGPD